MRGRFIPLSAPRTFVGDLIHFAVPSIPVERTMHIPEVAAARGRGEPRVPWPALFLKAYARVAAVTPELRRAYVCWPWPRLVEYPRSVASITVEREYRGDRGVFVGKIKSPDVKTLDEVAARIRHFVETPVEQVTTFRRQLRVSRRLVYDHRVLDGATVARALAALEVELNTTILAELRGAAPMRLAG